MSLDNRQIVDVIYGVGALAFFMFILVGSLMTIARMAYYRVNRWKRPRLLFRDAALVGGVAVTMGLIFIARIAGATNLRDNVLWALSTTVPVVFGFAVYAYFEVFVIERPKPGSTQRSDPYLHPREPDLPQMPVEEAGE